MLTLKVEDLKDGLRAMMALAQWKPANLKLAYNIGRTWKDYKERVEEADEMERNIYKEFKAVEEKIPNGIQLNLPADMTVKQRKAFDVKIKELRQLEMEVWGSKLSFEQLEKANAPLSGDDFSLLSWLIADPAEESAQPEKAETAKA